MGEEREGEKEAKERTKGEEGGGERSEQSGGGLFWTGSSNNDELNVLDNTASYKHSALGGLSEK